jgi:tRNA threonylcarbamoyladenosine dehydratase
VGKTILAIFITAMAAMQSPSRNVIAAGVLGAVAGIAVTAAIMSSKSKSQASPNASSASEEIDLTSLPPDIEDEVFSRNKSFFGDEGFLEIRNSFIVVVGLGGVGSHAAHMLARSGVGAMRVVDFDQVSLSSLNRHAVAKLSDVGRPKAEVLQKHLSQIVPWCKVDARASMFNAEHAATLLLNGDKKPDYVLDCIDDVNTKSELIAYCQKNGIPVITCCAAGGKADPTRLHMGMLSDASRDPLASKMRWSLKKMDCDIDNIMTVYSSENPRVKLLPLTLEQVTVRAFQIYIS